MSQQTEIRCDWCDADITYTGNSVDYRLVLSSQPKSPYYLKDGRDSGFVTDMFFPDPMPKSAHFCAESHLKAWINGEVCPTAEASTSPVVEP